MAQCSMVLRDLGASATSMEETAQGIVDYLYEHLLNRETSGMDCALVRLFKTHKYGDLDEHLKAYVKDRLPDADISPDMKCMVMLATRGECEAWNYRARSQRHQAIPLPSADLVERMPMVSQLLGQMGFDISQLLHPETKIILAPEEYTYGVFNVHDAVGSPIIPDQENFVIRFGIKSVLGFGAMLPSGNMFAVIIFAKVPIPRGTAELFRTLALSTKIALVPFDGVRVFSTSALGAIPQ